MRTSLCAVLAVLAVASAENLYQAIEQKPDLSEFFELINASELFSITLRRAEGTVFAPTNAALQKVRGSGDVNIQYHLVNRAMTSAQLRNKQSEGSSLKGNQKLFFSLQKRRGGEDDIFVNNARIVTRDLAFTSEDGSNQYLHIIDEVLEPTIPSNKNSRYYNPNALKLLSDSAQYSLGESSIKKFYKKVQDLDKTSVFGTTEFHTYFIPVDAGMQGVETDVDRVVVDGHMIPNKVLFTRTMGNDSYETMAFGDMLKVTGQLRVQPYPEKTPGSFLLKVQKYVPPVKRPEKLYEIQSRTLLGDAEHSSGSVLAKIVKPNIAVENGVIHLIEKPLMVMENSAFDFIQRGSEDRFFMFFDLLKNNAPEFLDTLRQRTDGTIFIPSNDAFYTVDQKRLTEIKLSPDRLKKLLNLHLVPTRVTTQDVRKIPGATLFSVPSEDQSRSLYLSVWGVAGKNQTMTVEGGGTNATVVIADIAARDGVIHIIDKLLGVPYRSVGEKLAVDAMMSDTNTLAVQTKFSKGVSRMDKKFTMLVPSNDAWKKIQMEYVTSHKSLFEGRASHPANTILERHFLIGEALSMDDLVNKSKEEDGVKFYKTTFHVENAPGMSGYLVKWQGMQARVTRSNVECTNGYIHVIDSVFMRQRDVTTASSAAALAGSVACLVAALAMLRL
ncbi:fasciclin-1-like isoform X1 [Amphibalanus amphitrite]|uniref:fasciclin-1-like isoform X1 n=1 Tax=Amphibalanus amphitrite TaxID=1232801 RepID=UPI001C91B995|nr:fasciclin-1-like isoform X1 [Amphibalanus amphitrite]